jgi:hypothetical protein
MIAVGRPTGFPFGYPQQAFGVHQTMDTLSIDGISEWVSA